MCQLQAKQAQAVATAASLWRPLLPGFLLPSGCHGGCCQCQLLASSVATNPGSLRGTWACTVRAWQTFQSTVQKCTLVPGHAADQRRHSSKYYNVAQLQNARQGNTGSANALFLVGKEKPNNVDLFKAKVWRKYHGNGHFTRYLSIPVALKNSVKVCSHSHSPQPSLAMQFDLYDTASQGHFLPKTKHHACFLGCHWADVTAPLQKQ